MGSTEVNYSTIQQAFLGLHILYADIGYTKISEQPSLTVIDLISNIGGTLGLFIGISMLSVFEITEILIRIGSIVIKEKYNSYKKKKSYQIDEKDEIKI